MLVDAWSPTPDGVTFDWSVSAEDGKPGIVFTLENRSDEDLWFCSQMLENRNGTLVAHDRPVVRNSGRDGVALLAFGFVPLDQPAFRQQVPAYTRLEPGARHEGVVPISTPLEAWHPSGMVEPVPEGTQRILFGVDFFFGEPRSWAERTTQSGQTVRIPSYASRHWAWSTVERRLP